MSKNWIWLVPVVAVAGTATWVTLRPAPVPVRVAAVQSGRVERTVSNTRAGTVEACLRAKLAPAVGGQIVRLPARRGERVEAGDLLLELWNEDLVAEHRLAEAEARAAASNVEEACAMAAMSARDAERLTSLQRRGVADVQATERGAAEAAARKAACDAAKASVLVRESRVAVVQAAIERTRLRAPFAGVVAEVNGELGEFVTPSPVGIVTKPAVDLVDDGCIHVKAPIDEVDAAPVRAGMETRITLDAMPGVRWQGRVARIATYVVDVEKQARTVEVEVDFDDAERARTLLPGYSADVEIVLEAHDGALRVPTEAVLEESRVLVMPAGGGTLEERRIEPGISNWDFTEALSGVAEGELVVTTVDREGVVAGARATVENSAAAGGLER